MKSPEEYAEELIENHFEISGWTHMNGHFPGATTYMDKSGAIQCTIITLDRIIEALGPQPKWDGNPENSSPDLGDHLYYHKAKEYLKTKL